MEKKCFLYISVLTLFFACYKKDNSININLLNQTNWLLGNWENKTKDFYFKEIWIKKNDSIFTANSFITVGKDTVFHENIDLLQKNDSLFYNVTVIGQNNEETVSFYCTKKSKTELVFENPKHDFPSKIVYKLITKDSIVATIHGINKGKRVSENFPMKKK